MKVRDCDVCEKEGKLVLAKYRAGWKTSKYYGDLCEEHKDFCQGKTAKEVSEILLDGMEE